MSKTSLSLAQQQLMLVANYNHHLTEPEPKPELLKMITS